VLAFQAEPSNQHSLTNNIVKQMVEDPKGRIWMATRTGICWYDPSQPAGKEMNQVPNLRKNLEYITVDSSGGIWATGFGGAFYYKPETGKLRSFSAENGEALGTKVIIQIEI
jgi:ligand-binding sensor domain-containing protein